MPPYTPVTSLRPLTATTPWLVEWQGAVGSHVVRRQSHWTTNTSLHLPSPGSSESGEESPEDLLRICVVGSGTRFISGISYYTYYLSRRAPGDVQRLGGAHAAAFAAALLPQGEGGSGHHITRHRDLEHRPHLRWCRLVRHPEPLSGGPISTATAARSGRVSVVDGDRAALVPLSPPGRTTRRSECGRGIPRGSGFRRDRCAARRAHRPPWVAPSHPIGRPLRRPLGMGQGPSRRKVLTRSCPGHGHPAWAISRSTSTVNHR